jgi:hypothetical protein
VTCLVTQLDRLARSTRDLLNILDAIAKAGAGFKSLRDTWADTTWVKWTSKGKEGGDLLTFGAISLRRGDATIGVTESSLVQPSGPVVLSNA